MVEDLCFHLVDMVQNAVAAGTRNIDISVRELERGSRRGLEVRDDGRGMDPQMIEKVQDPFFTTKAYKKVGLGIPLLKQVAQHCDGQFWIKSQPGRGTEIGAAMSSHHIDCPPLGDLTGTVVSLLVTFDQLNLIFKYENDRGTFSISTADIRQQVGDIHLSHPDVYGFLREYIRDNLEKLQK